MDHRNEAVGILDEVLVDPIFNRRWKDDYTALANEVIRECQSTRAHLRTSDVPVSEDEVAELRQRLDELRHEFDHAARNAVRTDGSADYTPELGQALKRFHNQCRWMKR